MDASTIVQLIGDLGALGFILYLVHRTTTHTIPRLADQYLKAEEIARQDFKEILSQQREDFRAELERERQINGQQTERIIDTMRNLGS